jgi:ribosomal protein L31E
MTILEEFEELRARFTELNKFCGAMSGRVDAIVARQNQLEQPQEVAMDPELERSSWERSRDHLARVIRERDQVIAERDALKIKLDAAIDESISRGDLIVAIDRSLTAYRHNSKANP